MFNLFSRKWTKKNENFPRDLMKVATKSDAFLYPLLLPHVPFNSVLTAHKTELMDSEEWLVVYLFTILFIISLVNLMKKI